MSAILGLDAKVYYLDPTDYPRATWGDVQVDTGFVAGIGPLDAAPDSLIELTIVKNVKYTVDKGTADVSTRGNNGWAAKVGTLKDASIDIEIVYDPADAGAAALAGSFLKNTPIALAILSGAAFDDALTIIEGAQGLWADFEVTKQDKDEPLVEGQMATFTLTPSGQTSVAPEWVQVGIPV